MGRGVDWWLSLSLFAGPAIARSTAVWAQTAAAPAAAAQAPSAVVDEDARPVPAEPDFVIIDLPTTLRLPLHRGNFRLTHRWEGNLRGRSFKENARDNAIATTFGQIARGGYPKSLYMGFNLARKFY